MILTTKQGTARTTAPAPERPGGGKGGMNLYGDLPSTAPRVKFSRQPEPLNGADFDDEQNDQTS